MCIFKRLLVLFEDAHEPLYFLREFFIRKCMCAPSECNTEDGQTNKMFHEFSVGFY